MESTKRDEEQVECSQTWTAAFAVSLAFTIVIGVLLVMYCIMYRNHIKFLFKGPPTRASKKVCQKKPTAEKVEIDSPDPSSQFATPEGSAMSTSTTLGNASMIPTAYASLINQIEMGTTNPDPYEGREEA